MYKCENLFINNLCDSELWADIVGYEGRYMVSSLGRIRSLKEMVFVTTYSSNIKDVVLKPAPNTVGYLTVLLYLNRKCERRYIHRLVCEAFLENPLNKRTVNHKNGDITDNRLCNLEYATHSENHLHAFRELKRKRSRQKAIYQFTLSGEFVAEYASAKEAATKINGHKSNISVCCNGKLVTSGGFKWKWKQ